MTEVQIWQPQAAEVAHYEPSGPLDDWIRVADQVVRLAEVICRTPFVPDGLRGNAPATAAAILTGRELQIPPMTSLANIHVIHGKPGLSALVMRALIQSQGHEWQDVEVTGARVVVRGRRKGTAEWTTASFSTADAQTAKLQLGAYPQDKLYARASARLARRAFADVIAGMPYSAEELEDGVIPDDAATAETAPAAPPAASAPRTAQRRTRTPAPAQAASPVAAGPAPRQDAGAGLPPLPGEEDAPDPAGAPPQDTASPPSTSAPDETDYDTPGTVTKPQIGAIWTILSGPFGFANSDADKEVARMACAIIIDRDLESTKNLSRNEAKAILDTLGHLQTAADKGGGDPRDYLTDLLRRTEEAREANGGE